MYGGAFFFVAHCGIVDSVVPQVPRKRALLFEVLATFMLMIPSAVFSGFLRFGAPMSRTPYFEYDRIVYQVLSYAGAPILILFVMWASGDRLKTFGFKRWKWWPHLPIAIIVFGLMWFSWAVPSWIMHWQHRSYTPAFDQLPLRYGLVLVYYLIVGFREELYFRSYLITRLTELSGRRYLAVLISVVLFTSIHAYQGWWGMFYAGIAGLILSGGFLASGSIWPMILAHGLYDFALFYYTYH